MIFADATSLAISSAALAQAAAAQETARCSAVVSNFTNAGSTVEQKRDYAHCVHNIYGSGEPLSVGASVLIKVVIVGAFIAIGIGAWRLDYDGIVGRFMGGLVGLAVYGVGCLVIGLTTAAVWFLFS